jgi:hypothetical protein
MKATLSRSSFTPGIWYYAPDGFCVKRHMRRIWCMLLSVVSAMTDIIFTMRCTQQTGGGKPHREKNQVAPRMYIGVGRIGRFRRNLLSVYTTPGIALAPPGVIFLTDAAMQYTHILQTQYPLPTQPCSALISYSCSISYWRSHAVSTSIDPQHNSQDARVQFTPWQNAVFTACDVHTIPWIAFISQATDTV